MGASARPKRPDFGPGRLILAQGGHIEALGRPWEGPGKAFGAAAPASPPIPLTVNAGATGTADHITLLWLFVAIGTIKLALETLKLALGTLKLTQTLNLNL